MHGIRRGLAFGFLGGVAGLVVMEVIRRTTARFVSQERRAPKPTDVFFTERVMSPLGPHHSPGESATGAVGRLAYEKLVGHEPSEEVQSRLSWLVHIVYGLVVAAGYGALHAHARHPIRDGALFAGGLWLLGDELAVPLLGLSEKPTAYPASRHVQSLAQHLGFGIAMATTTRVLEEKR